MVLEGAAEDPAHDTRVGVGFAVFTQVHSICRRDRYNSRGVSHAPLAVLGGGGTLPADGARPPLPQSRATRREGRVRQERGWGGRKGCLKASKSPPPPPNRGSTGTRPPPPPPRIYSSSAAQPARGRTGGKGAPTGSEREYSALFSRRAHCVSATLFDGAETGRRAGEVWGKGGPNLD